LEHVVVVPTANTAFHGYAVFLGMLLQQGQRETIQPSEVLAETLVTDEIPIKIRCQGFGQ
jgi:hypothetical protein